MREILLVFEGDAAGEERAAGLIQETVSRVLKQEKMNVKNFVNIARKPMPQAQVRTDGILQIPEFMKRRKNKPTV